MRLALSILILGLTSGTLDVCSAQTPLAAASACTPPVESKLKVTLRSQKTDKWCWAASAQMVTEYLHHPVEQCLQVNVRLHRTDCCQSPTPDACVIGGWPEFDKYGFTFKRTSSAALSWDQIKAELGPSTCGSTPFAFSWAYLDGSGHMMVATGYVSQGGQNFVLVNDPLPANVGSTKIMLYDVYDELPGDHSHWDDFYNVRHP